MLNPQGTWKGAGPAGVGAPPPVHQPWPADRVRWLGASGGVSGGVTIPSLLSYAGANRCLKSTSSRGLLSHRTRGSLWSLNGESRGERGARMLDTGSSTQITRPAGHCPELPAEKPFLSPAHLTLMSAPAERSTSSQTS